MEMKPEIEDQIKATLQSAKSMSPSELPYGFSDRVMNKLQEKNNNVRSIYILSPLLRVAAVFILVVINVITLRLALSPQPAQSTVQYGTIKDFVNEYQINDAGEEVVITNTPTYEQP
jgi:hypothetical protein